MKIKTVDKSYEEVLKLPKLPHEKPRKQWAFLRWVLKPICFVLLSLSGFTGCEKKGMEKLDKKEPCLVLMNHSSFIDLEFVAYLLGDRAYHIVTTLDAFVGLSWILRLVGCIPTKKFITDVNLVRDMRYTLKELKESVVMFPEASYSFDGTATPLPDSLGKCLKLLGVPVVMIRTEGAFLREPLYNCLQHRKVKLSAKMEYLLSPEDIKAKSVEELNEILAKSFDFDHFKTQQKKEILVTEPYRADGLHRVLYKCPHCYMEGQTVGLGTVLTCNACGTKYELTELGFLQASSGETLMNHIPDWYRWQRECVKKELNDGTYKLDVDVDICMLVNTKCVYKVGSGHLLHTAEGFHLTGCDGLLDYKQSPNSSYGLYSDFYWYEIGDMICVGDEKVQYYCFPKNAGNVVAKTRLAAEELYKMLRCKKKIKQWVADLGNGQYRNPILYTDYSDPDAIRVGDDYFMTASSFCNAPGLPVLHSKDLVNWTVINYAIKQIPEDIYKKPIHGCGVWAPAIRYHNGVYYIFFPMPDEGIYVTSTTNPWGEWSKPHLLHRAKGWIDPCPFWDEDGRCYMVSAYAKSRIGFKSILRLTELTPDCTKIIDMGKDIFDGNVDHQVTIEGPKLYKRNGYYYIFAPAGGVKQGWQTVLRSRNIWGPYEYKNVLMQKDTPVNGPHQGAWVDTQTGEDWFIHFQDVYAAGRIIHLQPMKWLENDWPIIGEYNEGDEAGKPVLIHKKPNVDAEYDVVYPEPSDEFEGDALGLQWQWNANWEAEWYTMLPQKSCIRLHAVKKAAKTSISNTSNLLLQKWSMPEFTTLTKISLCGLQNGDITGFVSLGEEYVALSVENGVKGNKLCLLTGTQSYDGQKCYAEDVKEIVEPIESEEIYFKMVVNRVPSTEVNSDGPYIFPIPKELVDFYYSQDGKSYKFIHSYAPKAGRWVGVKFGVYCCHEGEGSGGFADVDYVRVISKKE